MYMYTHTSHRNIHAPSFIHVQVVHLPTNTHTNTFIYTHTHMHTHTRAHTRTHTHTYTYHLDQTFHPSLRYDVGGGGATEPLAVHQILGALLAHVLLEALEYIEQPAVVGGSRLTYMHIYTCI